MALNKDLTQEIYEFRGVDNLYVARITEDSAENYTCEAPIHLAPVAEIGKSTDSSNESHFYDNKAMIVVSSEGPDVISITMAPPELERLAFITGKSFDETTGTLIDGERSNDYYALMYRTKGTDGKYRYVVRNKGTFSIPEETNQTENDGTDTTNTSVEFTGIYTTHQFAKGKYNRETKAWEKGSVKGVVVDTRYNLVDVGTFFDEVQTPDTITPKTQQPLG